MNDHTRLQELLRSAAERGGEPDEDDAWATITASIQAPPPGRVRRPSFVIAAALAIGTAAAAFVVVTTTGQEPAQMVDVGPADGRRPALQLPADPAVVVAPDRSAIHVLDAATGEHVSTPLSGLSADEDVISAAITAPGDIYFSVRRERDSVVAHTTWDADGGYEVLDLDGPDLGDLGSYGDVAVDPAGRMLAYGVSDVTPDAYESSIGVVDLRNGDQRQVAWPEDDPRGSYHDAAELSISADGSRLAFVNVHDTDGADGFDAFVVDLTDDTSGGRDGLAGASLAVEGRAWDITFDSAGNLVGLVGDTADAAVLTRIGGSPAALPPLDDVLEVSSTPRSLIARTDESWYRFDPTAADWTEVPFAVWAG